MLPYISTIFVPDDDTTKFLHKVATLDSEHPMWDNFRKVNHGDLKWKDGKLQKQVDGLGP